MKLKLLIPVLFLVACKTSQLPREHQFPTPVNTADVAIQLQEKKTYEIDGIFASNEFDAVSKINDSTYRVTILPENEPINESPHYAFTIQAETARTIDLELFYGDYDHRYYPKLSTDKENCYMWLQKKSETLSIQKIGCSPLLNYNHS